MNKVKFCRDERGSILVESTLSLVMFVGVLAFMISLIDIVCLYDRMQYAITQTANEISTYSYVYSASGLQGAHDKFKDSAAQGRENVENIFGLVDQIGGVLGGSDHSMGTIQGVFDPDNPGYQSIEQLVDNPQAFIKQLLSYAADDTVEQINTAVLAAMCNAMTKKYLAMDASPAGGETFAADEFLRRYHVDGTLDFSESKLFTDKKSIDIIVRYKVKYQFALVPLPVDFIEIKQRASVAGWLDGDGEHYGD